MTNHRTAGFAYRPAAFLFAENVNAVTLRNKQASIKYLQALLENYQVKQVKYRVAFLPSKCHGAGSGIQEKDQLCRI